MIKSVACHDGQQSNALQETVAVTAVTPERLLVCQSRSSSPTTPRPDQTHDFDPLVKCAGRSSSPSHRALSAARAASGESTARR